MGQQAPTQPPSKAKAAQKPEWTREEVAARILAGENLFIYRASIVRVPQSWLTVHPGGDLAILHFVGRDATDEVDAFHGDETLSVIQRYVVARVKVDPSKPDGESWNPLVPPYMTGWRWSEGKWVRDADTTKTTHSGLRAESTGYEHDEINPSSQILLVEKGSIGQEIKVEQPSLESLMPPPATISLKAQAQHAVAYKELHRRITDRGLYKTRFISGIGPDILRYILFGSLSVWFYEKELYFFSAIFLGALWHQLAFFVHDLGHMGVTHDWTVDRLIGITLADYVGGLSIGWWVDNHNVHHCNDPDIEHLPFFAISPHFISDLYSSYYKRILPFDFASKIFIRIQHHLFYIVMALARLNLYRLSYVHLFNTRNSKVKARGGRWSWWMEVIGIAFFWTWYIQLLKGTGSWRNALMYALVSHVVTSPLHIQIVLSHFSRSTADLGPVESFFHRQLRTTVDVICPDSLAFFHGGLHLQVTHHLFPRLPRHNLKAASKIVKEFAREQGLEYAEFGFVEGNMEVRGVLRNVAQQVKNMKLVADENIKEAIELAKD